MMVSTLSAVMGGMVFLYLLCQVGALRRWEGWWFTAAVLPASVNFVVAGKIVWEIGVNRDAHALWPLEAMLWSAAGLAYLSALYLAYGLFHLATEDTAVEQAAACASKTSS